MSLNIEGVTIAVIEAVRHFGPAYTGPCEFAGLNRVGASDVFTAAFNDVRVGSGSGSLFTIDMDTAEYATAQAIREYVIDRITRYTDERVNPRANRITT